MAKRAARTGAPETESSAAEETATEPSTAVEEPTEGGSQETATEPSTAGADPPREPEPPPCAACAALLGDRPCSVECFVKAGYKAETYEGFLANLEEERRARHANKSSEKPSGARGARATAPGFVRCRVTCDLRYNGSFFPEGHVGDFPDHLLRSCSALTQAD